MPARLRLGSPLPSSLDDLILPLDDDDGLVDAESPVTGVRTRERDQPAIYLEPPRGRGVRGLALRAFVQWYEVELGTPRFHTLLERVSHDTRLQLDVAREGLGLVDTRWYGDELANDLMEALVAHLSDQRRYFIAVRGGRVLLREGLSPSGSWLRSTEVLAAHAQTVWDACYDSGLVRVTPRSDVEGVMTSVRSWRSHHPLLCAMYAGVTTALYEALGKRAVLTTRLSCITHGDRECRFATQFNQ